MNAKLELAKRVPPNEARIATTLVQDILNAGLHVSVKDEDGTLVTPTRDFAEILKQLGHSGENTLQISGRKSGFVLLLWETGNDALIRSSMSIIDIVDSTLSRMQIY